MDSFTSMMAAMLPAAQCWQSSVQRLIETQAGVPGKVLHPIKPTTSAASLRVADGMFCFECGLAGPAFMCRRSMADKTLAFDSCALLLHTHRARHRNINPATSRSTTALAA